MRPTPAQSIQKRNKGRVGPALVCCVLLLLNRKGDAINVICISGCAGHDT
jgi:hypothetical protein